MYINKKGETFAGVIVTIAIISIVFISIFRMIDADKAFDFTYKKQNTASILEKNAYTIAKKIDTSKISQNETFYLYKTGSTINALTGSTNQDFQYINENGDYVGVNYKGPLYSRFCLLFNKNNEGKFLKCTIKEVVRN